MYKLNEPEKNKESTGYWLFVIGIIALMVYIMIINPILNWEWESTEETYTYVAATAGAFILAGLLMIPTIRNSNSHDYALAKLWANREYIEHEEYMEIIDILKPYMWKNNGSKQLLDELQKRVDAHKGKHITGHKYFKKEYIKDLELVSAKS